MDLWFCLVKSELISSNSSGTMYAYRLLKAIKITRDQVEIDRLYREYYTLYLEMPGVQTMLFTRNPDESMFTSAEGNDISYA